MCRSAESNGSPSRGGRTGSQISALVLLELGHDPTGNMLDLRDRPAFHLLLQSDVSLSAEDMPQCSPGRGDAHARLGRGMR
jgi:hypothetical protein